MGISWFNDSCIGAGVKRPDTISLVSNNKGDAMYSNAEYFKQNKREKQELLIKQDKCDKYDYLIAAGCGALGGVIDIFFVGAPGESKLGNLTDALADKVVMLFAKKVGWSPRAGKENSVASAIGFLEKKYRVNYDQATTKAAGGAVDMWTKDHHMKSLAHSSDIIGLFFSILNQFTSSSTFISNGKLITINSDTYELQGGNFISKIFCGTVNWFGHLMSDFAGSSGSRGNAKRGMGIVMPFYELLGLCEFGKFSDGNGNKQVLAMIATRAFTEGYDARFGLAMAIPVVITNLMIRLMWGVRRFFQYKKPLKECIPTNSHPDLRVMLIIGNGTLCVMDGIDAGIKSGGNYLDFFIRLNIIAWFRFVTLVVKEVCIRVGIQADIQLTINAFQRVNEALVEYMEKLKQIDIEAYRRETERYKEFVSHLAYIADESELNRYLLESYEKLGIPKPWAGNFDDFMGKKSNHLVFE
ncbi:hypothetical protein FC47_GL001920 [Limosilactobacillus mucosae DSM 13345]|uniref:Uncharacterized protein n=1 Tax=Limosilactobacillus mucosae DSM 13345 TaxID=1423771 RepID=A0A0R1P080_LIMMU|nr:hypothetical protein FC47_GL001920 [Limosilactobacillus mucosae DSM 13345]